MKSNIISFLIGFALAFWWNAGTPPLKGVVVEKVPVEMALTDSQLYLMTEILQDRIPKYDTAKYDIKKVSEDYVKMQRYVKDDINGALSFCLEHRGAKECNIYSRIRNKLDSL